MKAFVIDREVGVDVVNRSIPIVVLKRVICCCCCRRCYCSGWIVKITQRLLIERILKLRMLLRLRARASLTLLLPTNLRRFKQRRREQWKRRWNIIAGEWSFVELFVLLKKCETIKNEWSPFLPKYPSVFQSIPQGVSFVKSIPQCVLEIFLKPSLPESEISPDDWTQLVHSRSCTPPADNYYFASRSVALTSADRHLSSNWNNSGLRNTRTKKSRRRRRQTSRKIGNLPRGETRSYQRRTEKAKN